MAKKKNAQRFHAVLDLIEQMLAEWHALDSTQARRKFRAKLRTLGFVPIRFAAKGSK